MVDPDDRELVMGCGAALLNLRVALRAAGRADGVELSPDPRRPDLLARVRPGAAIEPGEEDRTLADAIGRRRTNRLPYAERKLPAGLLERLSEAVAREGAWLEEVTGPAKEAVAGLVAEGARAQMRDRRFRRELAAWLHPNRSSARDGLRGYGLGMGDLASLAGPLVLRAFDLGRSQAARDGELAVSAPALVVLGGDRDDPADLLAAGQALERLLLTAASEGVSASFLNQPVEVRSLRPRLAEAIGREGLPQLVLRLGYASKEVKAPPRRPLAEVLL